MKKSDRDFKRADDNSAVLVYLDKVDDRIKMIETYRGLGVKIDGVFRYIDAVPKCTAAIRDALKAGNPYGELFVKLTEILVEMQWSFFAYFEPLIVAQTKQRDQSQKNAPEGPRSRQRLPKEYAIYVARHYLKKGQKISELAAAVRRNWEKHFDASRFPADKLKPLLRDRGTLEKYLANLPELQARRRSTSKAQPHIKAWIYLPPPTWADALAFRDAQEIWPLDTPKNLAELYLKHRPKTPSSN